MDDHREGVHRLALQQQVHLHQVGGGVAVGLVVEAGVSLGPALELVEEVHHHLGQRQPVAELHPLGRQVPHLAEVAAAALAQLHDHPGVVAGGDDDGRQAGLGHRLDLGRGGHLGGVGHHLDGAAGDGDPVLHRGGGGDEGQVELPLEALADDLHVQQAQEAAAEPEAERARRLGLVGEAGVVEPELLQRLPELGQLVAVDRVEPGEDHGLGLPVAGQRPGRGAAVLGDGLARAGLAHVFDPGDEVADLARTEGVRRFGVGGAHPDLVGVVGRSGLHEPQPGPGGQHPVHHPHRRHHPPVLVEVGVEDQPLQRGVGRAGRGRGALDDGVEQLGHAGAGLGRDPQDGIGGQAQHLLDLGRVPVGVGRGQVDLVEGGHDLQVVLEGHVAVGQGLGLDALGRVHHQDHRLAGGQGAAHLVAEVDVAGGVDEVDHVVPPAQPHRLELDGDAPLPLQLHGVEELLAHLAGLDRAGELQHPVGQGGLAVVDVSNDRRVADAVGIHGLTAERGRSFGPRPAGTKLDRIKTAPGYRPAREPPRLPVASGPHLFARRHRRWSPWPTSSPR